MVNPLEHRSIAPYTALIGATAEQFGLPAILLAAMVRVESDGNTYAWNPEPHYRYLVDVRTGKPFRGLTSHESLSEKPPADFRSYAGDRDAEWWGQQASWGLLQVMGAVAREHGLLRTQHLPVLCVPALGLEFGARHLASYKRRFHGRHGWDGVVAAYTAGSPRLAASGKFENQVYVDKVRAKGGFNFAGGDLA